MLWLPDNSAAQSKGGTNEQEDGHHKPGGEFLLRQPGKRPRILLPGRRGSRWSTYNVIVASNGPCIDYQCVVAKGHRPCVRNNAGSGCAKATTNPVISHTARVGHNAVGSWRIIDSLKSSAGGQVHAWCMNQR